MVTLRTDDKAGTVRDAGSGSAPAVPPQPAPLPPALAPAKKNDHYTTQAPTPAAPPVTAGVTLPAPNPPRPLWQRTDQVELVAKAADTFGGPMGFWGRSGFFVAAKAANLWDLGACAVDGFKCENQEDSTTALGRSQVERLSAAKKDPGLAAFEKAVALNPIYGTDALSLPDFTAALQKDRANLAKGLADNATNIAPAIVTTPILKMVLNDPATLMRGLIMTPKDMRDVYVDLNAAHARSGTPLAPRQHALETNHVDFEKIDWSAVSPSKNELTKIADNLYYGEVSAHIPVEIERTNIVWAELLQRLSENSNTTEELFSVTYQGATYTRLDDFLQALKKTGHDIKVSVCMQVADLTDLSRNVDGKQMKVAAPAFARSGIKDANGREALIPLMHDELAIVITPPKGAKPGDPRYIQADARWYQGIHEIGFFPASVTVDCAWTSPKVLATLHGDAATHAAVRAGYYSVNAAKVAHDSNLIVDGYAVLGNCGDSVMAAVYDVFQGNLANKELEMQPRLGELLAQNPTRTFAYPYLIDSEKIAKGLAASETAARKAGRAGDAATFASLAAGARKLPNDATSSITSDDQRKDLARRALQIIELAWPDDSGKNDPFEAITHARKALREFLKTH